MFSRYVVRRHMAPGSPRNDAVHEQWQIVQRQQRELLRPESTHPLAASSRTTGGL